MSAAIILEMQKQRFRTNHILHLLLSIFTFGFWIPVWLLVTLSNKLERDRLDRRMLAALEQEK